MNSTHEVAHVLDKIWERKKALKLNTWQMRTLDAVRRCRTASLGGHVDSCDACGHVQISYNSCRNRHCPKCQGEKREAWIAAREAELLPVPYFHVVFTLPDILNTWAMQKPEIIYNILFATAWDVVDTFASDVKHLGAKAGMISILHTWGQNLTLHPHLHCIIPGGGVTKSGAWKTAKSTGKYLFPVKAMSKVYRAKFVAALRASSLKIDQDIIDLLFKKDWVVFAKRPFGSPKSVIEYLGRYTHKIAISNHRILSIDATTVTFKYKDYKHENVQKIMTLSHQEFVRRFAQHILPKRFVRMRHYGILSSNWKRGKLKILQQSMNYTPPIAKSKSVLNKCPCCKVGNLSIIHTFDGRGPPKFYVRLAQKSKTPSQS
jgi:hypothetical protein